MSKKRRWIGRVNAQRWRDECPNACRLFRHLETILGQFAQTCRILLDATSSIYLVFTTDWTTDEGTLNTNVNVKIMCNWWRMF